MGLSDLIGSLAVVLVGAGLVAVLPPLRLLQLGAVLIVVWWLSR